MADSKFTVKSAGLHHENGLCAGRAYSRKGFGLQFGDEFFGIGDNHRGVASMQRDLPAAAFIAASAWLSNSVLVSSL